MSNVTLLGCGGWGKNIARNMFQLGALKLVVDPSEEAAEFARQLGVAHALSVEEAIAQPDCDAVIIATPAATHFTLAMSAINAGKHTYIEKPISLSIAEGRKIEEAAKKAGVVVMVGHLLQYHPVYLALLDLAAKGRLGNVRHIKSSRLNLGMLRHEENVLWSFSPHDISMVLGLAGAAPEKVLAWGRDFFQPGIADVSALQLHFASGLTAEIRASWFHPEKEQKLVVIGDRAMAIFNDTADWDNKLQIVDFAINWQGSRPKAVRQETEIVGVPKGEPLRAEMQHFLDCIRTGTTPRTDAAEANGVLAVLEAAQNSMDQGGLWQKI